VQDCGYSGAGSLFESVEVDFEILLFANDLIQEIDILLAAASN